MHRIAGSWLLDPSEFCVEESFESGIGDSGVPEPGTARQLLPANSRSLHRTPEVAESRKLRTFQGISPNGIGFCCSSREIALNLSGASCFVFFEAFGRFERGVFRIFEADTQHEIRKLPLHPSENPKQYVLNFWNAGVNGVFRFEFVIHGPNISFQVSDLAVFAYHVNGAPSIVSRILDRARYRIRAELPDDFRHAVYQFRALNPVAGLGHLQKYVRKCATGLTGRGPQSDNKSTLRVAARGSREFLAVVDPEAFLGTIRGFNEQEMKLDMLWVEVTSRCNLRCRSCSKFYGLGIPYRDMDLELFKHIENLFFDKTRAVSLTGIGEPMRHSQIHRVFDILERYPGISLDFVSNGQLIDDYWLRRIGRFASVIALSIDGPTKELYNYNRPNGSFEHMCWLLETRNEYAARHSDFRLRFTINMVVMKYNFAHIPRMIGFAAKFGVESVVFVFMGYWGQSRDWYDAQNPYDIGNRYREIYEEARELAGLLGVRIWLPEPSIHGNPQIEGIGGTGEGSHDYQFCRVPFESLYINRDGKVSPCCAMQAYSVGNVADYSKGNVAQLWNGLPMRLLRSQMINKTYNELCLLCDLHYGINRGRPKA